MGTEFFMSKLMGFFFLRSLAFLTEHRKFCKIKNGGDAEKQIFFTKEGSYTLQFTFHFKIENIYEKYAILDLLQM